MLLINHTLTGVLLGLSINEPELLAPTAVASHLVLDMTPHFGLNALDAKRDFQPTFRSRVFIIWGILDFSASTAITIAACAIWPHRIGHILIGVSGADLPDFTYIPIVIFGRKRIDRIPGYKPMIDFLVRIQWYEHPPGLITEGVWLALVLYLLQGK